MTSELLLFALLGAHAYFDYAGQGDFMAKAKNADAPIPGVPFWQPLVAHSVIHGAAVALLTGNVWLGLAEFAVHGATDHTKCRGRISYNMDQAIHVVAKLAWWAIAVFGETL